MKFPETNKIHKQPIPEAIESNAKKLEERLKEVNWRVFSRAYLLILGYVLLTVFSLIVVVGIAKAIVNLIS